MPGRPPFADSRRASPRAEVGGRAAELADDHTERVTPPLSKSAVISPAVPDSRKGEQQKLAVIVRVGQGFVAADHRGGEHQLADGVALAADALALEDLPVAEQKICVFHKNALPFRGAYALSFISRTITAFWRRAAVFRLLEDFVGCARRTRPA